MIQNKVRGIEQPAPAALPGGRSATQLAAVLRAELARAMFSAGELIPSVRDLAQQHDLAKGTVSRALRLLCREGWLTPEPRRGYRVLAAPRARSADLVARPLAYLTHATAQSGGRLDDFQPVLLEGFRQVARERGWPLLVIDAGDGESPAVLAQRIAAAAAGGVVSAGVTGELREELAQRQIPIVRIDSMRYGGQVDTVVQEALPACLDAIDWLAARSHATIAFFSPPLDPTSLQMQERFCAAVGRCAARGVQFQSHATGSLSDPEAACRAARALLTGPDRPRAVFAPWQALTFALVRVARELDLRLGADLDVVGWCTQEQFEAQYRLWLGAGVRLPMVIWKIRDMALIAAQRLEERRRQPDLAPVHIRVPSRFWPEPALAE